MKKLIFFIFAFLCTGCAVVGIVGTPTNYEKKVPAEYQFPKLKDEKILVFVDQPKWLDAEVNVRYHLTEAISKDLTGKANIKANNIISYNELSQFRSDKPDFSLLSPAQAGKTLGADWVLLVIIQDYQLDEMIKSGYYKGLLKTESVLFDTATGNKIWPQAAESKSAKVGFEVESGGRDVAIERLVKASAYCTVRYFCNCPGNEFKIADDRSNINWEYWQ